MKKILFSILLMHLSILASAETVEIDGFWYNLDSTTKEAEVTTRYPYVSEMYSGSIEIPSSVTYNEVKYSVTSIGDKAFYACSSLEDFYCWANNVPSTNSDAFESTPCNSATLHVPAGSVDAYKNTYPWSLFEEIVALTDDDPSPTGVNSLKVDNNINPEATFSLDGRRLSNPQRGLNIIRMSDGSTKKVMIK